MFAIFLSVMPAIFLLILLMKWKSFVIPENPFTLIGGFKWDEFSDFEMTIHIIVLAACLVAASIDFSSDNQIRKLNNLLFTHQSQSPLPTNEITTNQSANTDSILQTEQRQSKPVVQTTRSHSWVVSTDRVS